MIVAGVLPLAPPEQVQAQLVINIYQSQDNANQTVWIFSGSSTVHSAGTFQTSGSSTASWQAIGIYNTNPPSNQTLSFSSLFSSSNTKDIASVNARIPSGGKTDISFASSATNSPTVTIGTTPASRTISSMFMNDGAVDDIGIHTDSIFNFGTLTGQASSWTGSGLMNKPIGDFNTGSINNIAGVSVNFASGGVTLQVRSGVIPEPEEYALVFGLFALGFVLFRRHLQKKRKAAAVGS